MKIKLTCLLVLQSLFLWGQKAETWTVKLPQGVLQGTLLRADSLKPGPVVLIIPGSGPTDRNGNNPMAHNNSLKMLADSLAAHHISSLRIDKRGIGQSRLKNFNERNLVFDDFVNDAVLWINKLKSSSYFTKIIIAGHSQGALTGLLAACKTKPDAYISLNGAGYPIDYILKNQLSTLVPPVKKQAYQIIDSLKTGKKTAQVTGPLYMLFRPSVQGFLSSWMAYDPGKILAACKFPALIIQGDTDLQITLDNALRLKKFKPKAKLIIIKGMNHILKPAPKEQIPNLKTYNEPNLQLHPQLVPALVRFIKNINY